MTRRPLVVAAVAAFAGSLVLLAAALTIPIVTGAGGLSAPGGVAMFALPFVLLGLVIALRRPGHPIGSAFVVAGCCFALQAFTTAYADAGLVDPRPSLAAADYAGNVTQWVFVPGVLFGYVLPFFWFPTGDALSRRWRFAARGAVAGALVAAVANALAAGPLVNYPRTNNPLGVDTSVLSGLAVIGTTGFVLALFAGIVGVFVRFHRSSGVERLQMRWFMVGVAGTAVSFAVQLVLLAMNGDVGWGVQLLALLPICTTVAVLRYRLFEIDRIISRTVSYTLVTALLVGVYLGCVALTTGLLPISSSVGVAASTLAVAAAFQPVRRRVQLLVDHRFNRSRYDAARIVEQFAVRLRDEVDADTVRTDLLSTVEQTVAPARVSVWLVPA